MFTIAVQTGTWGGGNALPTESSVRDILFETNAICALIIDKKGIVKFINKTYLDIIGKREEEVRGHSIGDITPETRSLIVIKTGKAIIGYNWNLNSYNMIASSVPLIKNGELVGCFAYSIFMDIWDAQDLVDNFMIELKMYRDEVRHVYSARHTFPEIIGQAENIQEIKALAQKAALHPSITVLISGESGTGKELFAHAIHSASIRSKMPFIRVNCAAIPENLLEAELFGYEEGSFTGARKGGSTGKFELANGGTIFLDEIGEMSLTMQSKLLVFLQEREFEKLGNHHPIRVNVRVIAATNKDLEEMIRQQKFREDLYYRLNVLNLEIPPLRDRIEDLPLLVEYLIPQINKDLKTRVTGMSDEAMHLLSKYNWPGNIRELFNVLQRSMLLADLDNHRTITTKQIFFMKIKCDTIKPSTSSTLKELIRDYEKQILAKVLEETNYNKTKTAAILDMDLSWLYKKIKQYGLTREDM
jgi:transcriptional regulator with PAS, ATPase and Fis domain